MSCTLVIIISSVITFLFMQPAMFKCTHCPFTCQDLRKYVTHYKFHRFSPNTLFRCGVETCSEIFSTYSAFKSHTQRKHLSINSNTQLQHCRSTLGLARVHHNEDRPDNIVNISVSQHCTRNDCLKCF